jgi:hypothetical protein
VARYRQVYNEKEERYELIPVDAAARRREGIDISVKGNFDAFVSPVDGSLIKNHRDLEDHNRRNNVVNSAEFSPEWYAKKRAEREKVFTGERSREQVLKDRQFINEQINRFER